jgi:hypothetical protein
MTRTPTRRRHARPLDVLAFMLSCYDVWSGSPTPAAVCAEAPPVDARSAP